jgi:hypothetical protein
VLAQQVDVRLDRRRLTRLGVVEAGRHAGGDDEVRVEPDEDETAIGAGEARRLGVERCQVALSIASSTVSS